MASQYFIPSLRFSLQVVVLRIFEHWACPTMRCWRLALLLATDRSAFCIDFLQQSKGALLSLPGFSWEIRPFARLHDFRFWNRRQV